MLSTIPLRLLAVALFWVIPTAAAAEDGYDLWLRYQPIETPLRLSYDCAEELASHLVRD